MPSDYEKIRFLSHKRDTSLNHRLAPMSCMLPETDGPGKPDSKHILAYLLSREGSSLEALLAASPTPSCPSNGYDLTLVCFMPERRVILHSYAGASLSARILSDGRSYYVIVQKDGRTEVLPYSMENFYARTIDGRFAEEILALEQFAMEHDPPHPHAVPTFNPFDPLEFQYFPAGHCKKDEIRPQCTILLQLHEELSITFHDVPSPKLLSFYKRHFRDYFSGFHPAVSLNFEFLY